MKKAALSLIVLAFAGGTYLAWPKPEPDIPLPLPGRGLTIRVPLNSGRPGTYHLEVWMPKVGTDLHVVDETLPCALTIGIDSGTHNERVLESRQVSSYGEFGWANVVLYKADPRIELDAADHVVSVSAGDGCAAASLRGATAAVAKDDDSPTERYLATVLLNAASKGALFVGLIGAAIAILRSKNTAT